MSAVASATKTTPPRSHAPSETYQEAAVMSENHSESDKQVHHATMLHHDDLADDDALDVHLGDGDIRNISGSHRDVRESF